MQMLKFSGATVVAMTLMAASVPSGVYAQIPVAAGAGSYASAPPAYKAKTSPDGPGFNATAMLTRKIYADEFPARREGAIDVPGRPLPTNDWWTDIINNQFSGALWSYPAMLKTSEEGVRIYRPSYWADAGKEMKSRSHIAVGSPGYRASAAIAKDWHDWDVVVRMPARKGDGEITVTSAHGMPFTWFEFESLPPEINFSDAPEFFGVTKEYTGVKIGTDLYGLYYPAASTSRVVGGRLVFDDRTPWLVVALLRDESDLALFAPYAASVPRSTRVSWSYDENAAKVTSEWTVEAFNLRDADAPAPVIQGFLPHAYKYALPGASLNFISGESFATPRGQLRLAVSDVGEFAYACRFSGMLPCYPAPAEDNAPEHGFRREVLDALMADYAAKGSFGGDTYWGGKGLVQMAMNMSFAKEAGNTAVYEESKKRLREAFADWLSYTPGEDTKFFSYYPRWGAMLGFDVSYDSDAFNDHHFHYGYFTYAAALLCLEDASFAAEYGEILTMIAKDYANWDRGDGRFPFMRTLDPWCGHSWAGGLGDHGNDNGNGQESTSEAMQSWGGLYLLGVALGNREMRDAGIWGWSTEARATREYWYDVDAPRQANAGGRKPWPGKGDRVGNYRYDEYPYAYNSNITGKGIGWWTWFGGDPLFMHGIQWMPVSPALDYLSWDTDFVAWAYDDMMRGANSSFSHEWFVPTVNSDSGETIEPLAANDWGNVALTYLERTNPSEAARIFDEAWERGMHIAKAVSTAHISYFVTHSHLTYGDPDFEIHADMPTAQVRVKDGVPTYIVYNPGDDDREVRFYNAAGAVVRTVTAPARRMAAISAEPVPSQIDISIVQGCIIPPGEASDFTCRVFDQYGAGMRGEDVAVRLSEGAPAGVAAGRLSVNADAPRGEVFVLEAVCGNVVRKLEITVNDRPVAESCAIDGLPDLCERSSVLNPSFSVVDKYGVVSSPEDVVWTCVDGDGLSVDVRMPLSLDTPGKYRLTASSQAMAASAEAEIFVTPAMPLLSVGARVAASGAENVGSMPDGVCDGDESTRWSSLHRDDQWIVLDLGEDCRISRTSILWEAAYAARYDIQLAPDGAPLVDVKAVYAGSERTVRVPAESAWTTVVEESAAGPGLKTSVINASGRYIRMRGVERGSAYGYSIYEMSVYGLRGSLAPDDVIGVDFALPEVLDSGESCELHPVAFTLGGERLPDFAVEWGCDKPAEFAGNVFTPLEYGFYTITADVPGAGASSASVFVNEVERPASVRLEADSYTVVEGDVIEIPFMVMNRFLAPYSGGNEGVGVSVLDGDGNPAAGASYDVSSMEFSAGVCGVYTLDFDGMASCVVAVRPLSEVNLALGRPAEASSSNGDNSPALAVDGKTQTRWESAWNDSQTFEVDLESVYLIDRVTIDWEGAYAVEYRLQASADGDAWHDFYAAADCAGGVEALEFAPVAARFVRLCCDRRALPAYGFSVREFEVYGRRRLADDETSAYPSIALLDADTSNGAIEACVSAEHPSGSVFLSLALQDSAGNELDVKRLAASSGLVQTVVFDNLDSGSYSLVLTAADAFGNETVESLEGISVTYSIAGINLALGKRAWESSKENNALAASYAVDGKLDTRWGSAFEDDQWMVVDLGKAYSIANVRIYWNAPAYATSYSVLLSPTESDDDFVPVASRTDFRRTDAPENHVVDGRMARYVKLVGHRRATPYGTSVNELEVYGNDLLTGLEGVTGEAVAGEVWYTLQGIRVAAPSRPGIYIRLAGGAASKHIFK